MTRDELLASLAVERYTSPWWTAASEQARADERLLDDSEITCARRRRDLEQAWSEHAREATA